jgi:hypothetical protein
LATSTYRGFLAAATVGFGFYLRSAVQPGIGQFQLALRRVAAGDTEGFGVQVGQKPGAREHRSARILHA